MATSGIEEAAARLLGAFYDLSYGRLTEPVPLRSGEAPQEEGAAQKAGMEPGSTEPDVAVRYLLDEGYAKQADAQRGTYTITVAGQDRVRTERGISDPPELEVGKGMSDQAQKRIQTILSIALAAALARPVDRFIDESIPERRGVRDDLLEAVLQGLVRMTAFFVASVVVRKIASLRR